jgi:hypothetical protein
MEGHAGYQSTWKGMAREADGEQLFGLVVIHNENVSAG